MLLDLMLALTILLLLFAIVWSSPNRGSSAAQQAATALDIASVLRLDRSLATRDGVRTGTRIDLAQRTITGATGRRVTVPDDIAIEVTTASPCIEGGRRFVILFAPDGSSCGGVVVLKRGDKGFAIRINWLSGMIDVVSLPKV
jgi:general secretion pathway protein H